MSRITHTVRGAVAIAAVAVTALTLSACSGSSDGGASAAPDTAKIVIGLDSDQAALGYDPLRYGSGQRMFFEGIYDSLFVLYKDGQVVPQLVTKSEYNADMTQLTLDLDTSATFNDGTAVSADLVKQNLDFRNDPTLSAYSSFATKGQNEITDVTVVDDDTVTLTFAAPHPGFEANLTLPAGAIVGPAGVADRKSLDSTPDGSGPLDVDTSATVKGNSYLLVKKADNPDADAYPFDSYEFKPIIDPQAPCQCRDLGRGRSREHHGRHAGADRVGRHGSGRQRRHGSEHHRVRQGRCAGSPVGRPPRVPGAVEGDRPRDLRQRDPPG